MWNLIALSSKQLIKSFCFYRARIRTPGQEPDSPLPPIHERLAHLRPSRELLEFYRQKIAQYDSEHEELLQMLEKYRSITEDQVWSSECICSNAHVTDLVDCFIWSSAPMSLQHKLQWEVRKREGEITELQNALSDLQVYLFQEREQSLRLYAENDRLKIRWVRDFYRTLILVGIVVSVCVF